MTIFSLALHDTNRAHSLSGISLLVHCTQSSTLGLSLSLSLALSFTDYPRHPQELFLHKFK